MTELTDNQIELLRAAASANEGAVEAPADQKGFQSLIKRGLFIAMPQINGPTRLLITDGGRAAIGLEPAPTAAGTARQAEPADDNGEAASDALAAAETPQGAKLEPKAPGGKIGVLVALLQRPEGASLADAQTATGWQVHSVRGAISGAIKKKLGLEVTSEKTEAGRIYRIVAA